MSVKTHHNEYASFSTIWKQCRAAADGTVKKEGSAYLPILSGHSSPHDEDYRAFLQRAYFYNATGRTIDALHGVVFSKDPIIVWPESKKTFVDDINLEGCDLDEFAGKIVEERLKVGRFGVLVDHNGDGRDLTKLQAEQSNIRPKLCGYKAENIINWRYERINRKNQLTLVVLKEKEAVSENLFEVTYRDVYRVLELRTRNRFTNELIEPVYVQSEYRLDSNGGAIPSKEVTPTMGVKPFDYIPFRFFPDESTVQEPPLLDLVETNLAHYRTSADYEHGTHYMGMPTVILTGGKLKQDEAFPLGGIFTHEDATAKVQFLEFQGEGLAAIERNLDRKESQMASLGARLLQESSRQVETAEAIGTKQNGENCVLAAIAKSTSKGLTWCLQILAEWDGIQEPVSIELNTDYLPESMDPQTITALSKSVQSGHLSKETFVYNIKRGGYMEEGRTLDQELGDIEEESMPPTLTDVSDFANAS